MKELRYFGSLTNLNRDLILLKKPGNYLEISFITEKSELAVFKINKILHENWCLVSDADEENEKLIEKGRKEHANTIIISCKKYLETIDVAWQVKSNLSGIESFVNTKIFEPERSKSRKENVVKIINPLQVVYRSKVSVIYQIIAEKKNYL